MKRHRRKIIAAIFAALPFFSLHAQEESSSIYMDFRSQKISDIIYSVADVCGASVLIDDTVTGTATFRFEDKDFDSAMARFASHCQLFVEKNDGVYTVSKVRLDVTNEGKLAINAENVQVEPFLNLLSRRTNKTILSDALPNTSITIRVSNAELEDVLNLAIVKLPGFGLERIADGYYLTKSGGNLSKRNIDVFTLSAVDGKFSCKIQKASFSNVVDTLFKKGGREYSLLAKPSVTFENMTYTDKEFDAMLSLILWQCNCDFTVSENIYYIYEVQKKDVVKKFKETRVIQIKNIGIEALSSLLPNELNAAGFMKQDKNTNSVILTGSPAEIKPIEDFIRKIDVPCEGSGYKSFYLENISVKDAVAAIPKSLLMSDIIQLPSANGFVTQVTEESGERLSGLISILDSKKKNQVVKLKYIKGDELVKTLPPSVDKDSITETNDPALLFFTGTEQQFSEFSKELMTIDRPKQQIKYQLLVIQRQKTDSLTWTPALEASSSDSDSSYSWSGALSSLFSINFDIISKFGVQFAESLSAELSAGKSNVLADTTLNGISGEPLSFSNTTTYRYRDIIVDTDGDLYTSTTREITSGLTLAIDGWVSGDGMITVKVDAQVSKQGSADSSSSSSSDSSSVYTTVPPSTTEKKVSTNVRTKSGEPVVIGGLYQQEDDVSEKRIPMLSAIPLLGRFFKTSQAATAESEFVIYLVPFAEKASSRNLSEDENLGRLEKKYAGREL